MKKGLLFVVSLLVVGLIFSPCAWSKVKAILRKIKARTETELIDAIADALEKVTASDCLGWFKSDGYIFS